MKRLRGSLTLVISALFVLISAFLFFESKTAGDRRDALSIGLFFIGAAIVSLASSAGVQARKAAQARRAADSQRAVFRVNRLYFGAMGFGALCWLAAGITNLSGNVWPIWLSWLVIAFAAVCALVLLALASDWRQRLVIDAQGIHEHGVRRRDIPWEHVQLISFVTPDGEKLPPVLRIASDEGGVPYRSPSSRFQLDGDADDIRAAAVKFAPAARHIEAPLADSDL